MGGKVRRRGRKGRSEKRGGRKRERIDRNGRKGERNIDCREGEREGDRGGEKSGAREVKMASKGGSGRIQT